MDGMSSNVLEWARFIAVLIAAGVVGNWFMAENRKNKLKGGPWYGAYISVPGLIIIVAIVLLPIAVVFLKK